MPYVAGDIVAPPEWGSAALPALPAIISVRDLALRWGYEVSTLRDPRWRERLGLPLIQIGGRFIGVYEHDVIAIEARGHADGR